MADLILHSGVIRSGAPAANTDMKADSEPEQLPQQQPSWYPHHLHRISQDRHHHRLLVSLLWASAFVSSFSDLLAYHLSCYLFLLYP